MWIHITSTDERRLDRIEAYDSICVKTKFPDSYVAGILADGTGVVLIRGSQEHCENALGTIIRSLEHKDSICRIYDEEVTQ